MKVLIAGGSGFLGRSLMQLLLNSGYEVSYLTRSKNRQGKLNSFYWNPQENYMDPLALTGQDVVINLAGAGIADSIWTKKRKKEILESRISATRLLVQKIKKMDGAKPSKFISASAIGYYGSRPFEELTETSAAGTGFLSEVCTAWEAEALELNEQNLSTIIVRIGIVLSEDGGYLPQLEKMVRSKMNIIPGNGKQQMSWIHLDDLLQIILFLIEQPTSKGIYNCVAPESIRIKDFQVKLFRKKGKSFLNLRIPAFILKTLLGNFSDLFLSNQNVLPHRLLESGFRFSFKNTDEALTDLFGIK